MRLTGALAAALFACARLVSWSAAAPCTALAQPVLTSEGCPEKCGTACVLFSPLDKYKSSSSCAAPFQCQQKDGFVVPGAASTTACTITYACVDTNAPVVQLPVLDGINVQNVKYGSAANVVVINGSVFHGHSWGHYTEATLDASVFQVPDSVYSFYLLDIDMHGRLSESITLGKGLEFVTMYNTNLTTFPKQLADLTSMKELYLGLNNLAAVDNISQWQTMTEIQLGANNLTDLTVAMPNVKDLDVSSNPLSRFPPVIFDMHKLKILKVHGCNLTNVHMNHTQFKFLQGIDDLDADFKVTKCRDGFAQLPLIPGATVCVGDGAVDDPITLAVSPPQSTSGNTSGSSTSTSSSASDIKRWGTAGSIAAAVVVALAV